MNSKNSEKILNNLLAEARKQDVAVHDDLRVSLRKKLEKEAQKKEKNLFLRVRMRAMIATAASLFILLSVFMIYENYTEKDSRKLYYESTVSQGKPVTVKLVYNAVTDLKNVNFHIELGKGLVFHSQNKEISEIKSHDWTGSLKKGENIIPFVVKTSEMGKMRIKAYAEYEKFRHSQEIVLDSQEGHIKVSMYRLPSVAL